MYFWDILVIWQFCHQQSPVESPTPLQPPPWWYFITAKCHYGLLLALCVRSQKPFVSDADQTSKSAMLGWCSSSFHEVRRRTRWRTLPQRHFPPSLPVASSFLLSAVIFLVVNVICLIHFFLHYISVRLSQHYINVTDHKSYMCSQAQKHPFFFHTTVP